MSTNSLLNKQINNEFSAAYEYLAMSTFFASKSLDGFAHWMKKQAEEEVEHAEKIRNYLVDRGVHITFTDIKKPATFASTEACVKAALKAEQNNTKAINTIVKAARKANDIATEQFLQWFVEEQVEEEAAAAALIDKVKMAKDILVLDAELAKR